MFKNWKTTTAGAITALGVYFTTQDGVWHLIGQALSIGGPLVLGLLAKDHNVTGGSVNQ